MAATGKQQFLIDHLAQSAEDFEKSIATVHPSQWSIRADSERWSIGEIAEHVLIIDTRVAAMGAKLHEWSQEAYDAENSARKDLLILKVAVERSTRIEAPPQVLPTGKLATAAEFYVKFREAQAELALIAAGNPELLRGRFRDHPILKKLDGYQWLLACSCHRRRHMDQIEDVKKALVALHNEEKVT